MPVDQLNQVVSVGDTVVYYNSLYKVKTVGSHYCTARLLDSNTTRNKPIYLPFCINVTSLLPQEATGNVSPRI